MLEHISSLKLYSVKNSNNKTEIKAKGGPGIIGKKQPIIPNKKIKEEIIIINISIKKEAIL